MSGKAVTMPQIDEYLTIKTMAERLGIGQKKIKDAIKALEIEPRKLRIDERMDFYTPQDFERVQDWLAGEING